MKIKKLKQFQTKMNDMTVVPLAILKPHSSFLATTSMSHYQSCAGTGYGTCVFKGLSIC